MGLFKRIERNANARKYQKTIEQSSGLKKIHLMIRNHGVDFTFMFSHAQGGSKLVFMLVNVVTTENLFADIFFTTLNDSIVRAGGSTDEMFSNLANELYRDYNKQKMIASRLYGVAFAIILHKAADISRKAINKTGVDKFIDSSGLNEGFKDSIKESFGHMMAYYEDPISDAEVEGAMASYDLGAIAYSLVDKKLEKGNYADPLYTMAFATAEALSYREANVGDSDIDALKATSLLK